MALMGEYLAIQGYYADRTAERSGVPLMNHIDEGLKILQDLGASEVVWRAFCIHPLVQDSVAQDLAWSRGYNLACEYRDKANSYLCAPRNDWVKTVKDMKRIVGRMSKDCALMLKADKLQNQKDFWKYHQHNHVRRVELEAYFILWLKYLETILNPKRNPPTSVKQILVREFNWKMGRLRRLEAGAQLLTGKERIVVEDSVRQEMVKQQDLHTARLYALSCDAKFLIENDLEIQSAIHTLEYERNIHR